jgi:apolipoprotein N-acyltransferase
MLRVLALAAPLLSGLLLGVSCRWPGLSWLAWLALIPLAAALRSRVHRVELYAGAFLGGAAFHLLALDFMRADSFGMGDEVWLMMGYALVPFFLGAFWCGRILVQRGGLPAAVALPAAWVAMELARRHLLGVLVEFGFPFLQLGATQVDQTHLVQVVDLTGVYGLSWLVTAVSGAAADVAHYWAAGRPGRLAIPLTLAAGPLVLAYAYGAWRLAATVERPGPTVALMPGVLAASPVDDVAYRVHAQVEAARMADRGGAGRTPRFPDLLVWGEDALEAGVGNLCLVLAEEPTSPLTDRAAGSGADSLGQLARRLQAALAVGLCRRAPESAAVRVYGSLAYFTPQGGYAGCYDKVRLGPGFEFQPRLGRLASSVLGREVFHPRSFGHGGLTFGERFPVFRLEADGGQAAYTFAGVICYDTWFPEVFRTYLNPRPGQPGPDFFVNLANETMTLGSPSGYAAQALASARLRAIECRRAVVRCCADGHSVIIDSCGRVRAIRSGRDATKGVLVAGVPIDDRRSLLAAVGDLFALGVSAAIGSYLVVLVVSRLLRGSRSISSFRARTMPEGATWAPASGTPH